MGVGGWIGESKKMDDKGWEERETAYPIHNPPTHPPKPKPNTTGDEYVKAEFQAHKTAKSDVLASFQEEWNAYLSHLQAQKGQPAMGAYLTDEEIRRLVCRCCMSLFFTHSPTHPPTY